MQARATLDSLGGVRRLGAGLRRLLPAGYLIPEQAWRVRHAAVLVLLFLHVPIVFTYAMARDYGFGHSLDEALVVTIPAIFAALPALGRRPRSLIATGGLLIDSAVLVHISGGLIEMHFHYFVMLSVIALYQDWAPFLFSLAFVVGQHSVLGLVDPDSVFAHAAGRSAPMTWALIHGSFILLASVANLAAWKISERYTLYDPLTDLANRSLFRDRLEEALASLAGRRRGMAVLYVDLDHFKEVNDTLGHDAGDEVLVEVARRLVACIRNGDMVARLGGDEFGILLTTLEDLAEAPILAERVIQAVSQPIEVKSTVVHIGASVGIATSRGEPMQAEVLVRAADQAMYLSKSNGRGRYTLHETQPAA